MSLQQNCLKEINTDNLDIINITDELYNEEEIDYNNYEIKYGGNDSDEELGSSESSEKEENSSDKELGSSESSEKKGNSSDEEIGSSESSEKKGNSSDEELGSSDSSGKKGNSSDEELVSVDESDERELITDIADYEEDINYLNTERINIGDYVKIKCKDKKNKLNDKEGDVIFRSENLFIFRNSLENRSYILECQLFEILDKDSIETIDVLKANKNIDFLAWKDINVGNRVIVYNDKYTKEGVILKNINKIIDIQFDDEEDILILDLSNGLRPETEIYNIERADVDLVEKSEEGGIEILEDQDLQELLEIVPVPEEERLYSNQEEFNDMFENLIGQVKHNQINRLVENEIKKSIELFFKIRDETTSYSKKTGKIERLVTKNKGYKQTVYDIVNNNFENISLIPIVNDKKKIYVGTESLIENEQIYQVNFNTELEEITNITTEFVNGDYNSLGNSFDIYYKTKNDLEVPDKPHGKGYEYFTKKDLLVSRNCFENGCEYINEKNTAEGGGIDKLNFSLRKSLSGLSRPLEELIKKDSQEVTEKTSISNPEKINIIGFISFPEKIYINKNPNNIENLKELYFKYNYLGENYKKYLEQNKTEINKVYLNKKYEKISDLDEQDINRKFKLLISINDEKVYFEGQLLRIEGDEYFFRNLDEDSDSDIEEFVTSKEDERITSIELLQSKYLDSKDIDKIFKLVFRNSEDSDNNFVFEGKLTNVTEGSYFFEPIDKELIRETGGELQEFDKDNEDIIAINEIRFSNDKIQIYLFEDISENITKTQLENLCNQIVPSLSEILEKSVNKSQIMNNSDIEKYLSQYNISINNVHAEEYKLLKNLIEKNISQYLKNKEKENELYLSSLKNYKKNLQKFRENMKKRDFDFFPNKYFSESLIKEYYNKYEYNNLLPDNGIFRLSWLDSQADFGLLFYKVLALEEEKEMSSKEKIQKIKEEYENTLKELVAKFDNIQRQLIDKNDEFPKIDESCNKLKLTKIYYSYEQLNNDNGREILYDKDLDTTPFKIKEKILSENPADIVESPEFLTLLKDNIKEEKPSLSDSEVDIIIANINNGGKKVQIGDMCLLKDGTDRVFERVILGDSPDNVWVLSNIDINSNQAICNQQGKSLGELEISDLEKENTCMFEKNTCISDKQITLQRDIKNIQNQIDSVRGALEKINDIDQYKDKIEGEKNKSIQKIVRYREIYQSLLNKKEKEYQKIQKRYSDLKKERKSKIFKILKKIMSERNILKRNINLNKLLYNKKYVRVAVEAEDPDWLYTQDTNEKLISVHWLLKIRITLEPEKATEIIQEMIDKYGVYESGSEQIISKVDGDPLREIDNEIFEGFEDDEGGFKNTREILIQDKIFSLKESENIFYREGSIENDVYNIVTKFLNAIFIEMKKESIEEIVGDTNGILKSQYLGNPEDWKENKIQKGLSANSKKSYYIDRKKYDKSKTYRNKIQEKIDKEYIEYKDKLVLFSTVSRLFIELQTSIPDYKPEGIYAGCNFSLTGYPLTELDSPTENNGITYIVCVLKGLSSGKYPWSNINSWKLLKIRTTIIEWIDLWMKETTKLPEKYKLKIESNKLKEDKIVEIKESKDYWANFKPNLSGIYKLKETKVDLQNIKNRINKVSNKEKREIFILLEARNNWLSSEILNEINQILSKNKLEYINQFGIPLVQNTCCYNNIIEYTNYLDFFIDKSDRLKKLLDEMKEIQEIYDTYVYSYVNPLHLVNKYPYQITESKSSIMPNKIKEKDIYTLFLLYSNQALSFGQNRIFNKFGRCLVTGEISKAYLPNLSLEERVEALKTEKRETGGYTIEEYNLFLQKLYENNIIKYKTEKFVENFNKIIEETTRKYPFLLKNNDEDEEDFVEPIMFLKDKMDANLDEESLMYVLQDFRNFIDLEINSIINKIERVLVLEENVSGILKRILENLGSMNRIYEKNILLSQSDKNKIEKSETEKDITKINFIKNYINKYILTNISKIKNKKNNLIINIPNSWNISEEHSNIVKKSIEINNNYLREYIDSEKYSDSNYIQIFNDILKNLYGINTCINKLTGINNIVNCAGDKINLSNFSTKSCSLILHYIFLRIINYIIRKEGFDLFQLNEESSSSSKNSEKSSSSKKSEVIKTSKKDIEKLMEVDEEIVEEVNFDKKQHKDTLLCNFVKDMLQQIYIDQQILDVTDTDLSTSIGKSKEEEKSKFVTRLDKKADEIIDKGTLGNKEELATQLREVDRELKKYKIGPVWSRGIGYKGEYSQDDYKDLREKDDFERNSEIIAKKKFGRDLDEEELQLFQTRLTKNQRIARDVILENYNLQAIPGDALNVPGVFVDPGYGGNGGIPGGLVERQGGLQYGDDQQNLEDYGDGNDGAGAAVGMRLA